MEQPFQYFFIIYTLHHVTKSAHPFQIIKIVLHVASYTFILLTSSCYFLAEL